MAAANKRVHVVIAGAPRDCGEKVSNLRAAVQQAGPRFDVYVFCDSDGRPARNWLSHMVAPLGDAKLGAVTTFRWYFQKSRSIWSALASAWNAPAVTYLGEHTHNFCWGGGTAMRRERFEQAGVYDSWSGSVSDDLSLTHALRHANFPILYAPECLVPCFLECNAAQLVEFTNRQLVILRVYEERLWALGGAAHLLYCGAVLSGLGIFFFNLFSGLTAMNILLLALVPPVLSMMRGVLRLAAVMELLPEWRSKLLADGWIWTMLAAVAPFLALWNSAVALFTRRIRWRGIRYELISPTQTRIVVR
jgi:cellulose synthase/poly-beta-1,6-N-acetylglucosamine synthase-like glycosyltransferase